VESGDDSIIAADAELLKGLLLVLVSKCATRRGT